MKKFWLQRNVDASGVSGTGVVAEGVIFKDREAVLHWLTATSSIAIYRSIEELEAIHGHQGSTKIIYELPEEE